MSLSNQLKSGKKRFQFEATGETTTGAAVAGTDSVRRQLGEQAEDTKDARRNSINLEWLLPHCEA